MKKHLTCLILFSILLSYFPSLIQAQDYDLKTMPPLDPKVRSGILENGMHYYIRSNKIPENRAEFFIATNIGAIQENDDQNGLAHFTEHMAFNGTENFPKKGILDYLATIGVKFGTNVNAGTGLEQTIYNMSNVPLQREGILDTALLILHDWAHYLSFEPSEIDLERGVIREEWRMYGSADERMNNALAPIIYKGSQYAKRNVIGDTAVINHFKYQTLTDFYKNWYRTDLQAIIVVGDFNEAVVEAKIKKIFSGIPKLENPPFKEIFPVPDNQEPLIGTATDKEAVGTMVQVSFKHEAVKDHEKNLGYMRLQLIRSFINTMLGTRLNELSRVENPPFLYAYSSYGRFTRNTDAFTGMAQAANNQSLKALTALLTEMDRMKRYGFTPGEFERAKADILRNYDSRYMERDKRKNRELVYANVANFLGNTPNPGIEFEYQFAKTEIPKITLEEINQEAMKYVTKENEVITITGPDKPGIIIPDVTAIQSALSSFQTENIKPYVDVLAGKKLIEKDPISGKVMKTSVNQAIETTEWTLSNGMRVIFKPTDIKEDELLIRGYSPGGASLVPNDKVTTANFFGAVVSQMGVGNFSRTDLNKMMAGKRVNVTLQLPDDQDLVAGRTSPKDLETTLQLIYLYFTHPRWNESDYNTWMAKVKAYYINAASDPRTAFSDTVDVMMSNHNPRVQPINYKLLDEVTFERVQAVYKDRFSDPGNFTFQFVGKINPEAVKPMVEKYLASLPTIKRKEAYKDQGVRPPKGKVVNDFNRENKTPRTSVFVNYNGECTFSANDKLLGAALRHILELRYIQSIREDEGGTYSVRISYNLEKYPIPGFSMNISFDTDPAKADKLVNIVHNEINKLIENGPTETDLQKAKEYFLKQRPEDMKENNWWSGTLSDYYLYNLDYLNGYENNVKALTVQSVHDYARKTLSQGNVVEVLMRP
ncbi:MAG: insulinase family protein [Bacteroidales bacterium]|nr:insulinase family protein [Bacteroidales bacterium]